MRWVIKQAGLDQPLHGADGVAVTDGQALQEEAFAQLAPMLKENRSASSSVRQSPYSTPIDSLASTALIVRPASS